MKFKGEVHSCTEVALPVKALFEGNEVEASVPGLVIEVTSGEGRSWTFDYVAQGVDDLAAQKLAYAPGTTVEVGI